MQARVLRRGGFPTDYHATTLALGTATENLARALSARSIDVDRWRFGVPDDDGIFAQGPVADTDPGGSGSAEADRIPPAWLRRHTNRRPYRRYRRAFDDAFHAMLADLRCASARVVVLRGEAIARAAGWVRDASSIRFRTREVNEWFAASLRFDGQAHDHGDGLHVTTLALPPGGSAILRWLSDWKRLERANRFGVHRFFAAIEASNFRRAPAVLAVVGPRGHDSAFDAGRCLQSAWLAATDAGRSGHPYYVVSDLLHRLDAGGVPDECVALARSVRERVQAEFGEDRTLHCLMRVGVPVGGAPFSARLAPRQLLCERQDERERDVRAQ